MGRMSTLTEGITPNLEVQSISLNYSINYNDVTDEANPKSGNYNENVNLNFSNESELNRVLTEKPYLVTIVPSIASRLVQGFDRDNITAKKLKTDVKAAIEVKP